MARPRQLSPIAGIAAALCYVSLALLAFSRFPGSYAPLDNWLSDLGSRSLNPQGARFYNLGIIATAVLLGAFFLGLSRWRMEGRRMQRAMLRTTQASSGVGVIGSSVAIGVEDGEGVQVGVLVDRGVLDGVIVGVFVGATGVAGASVAVGATGVIRKS